MEEIFARADEELACGDFEAAAHSFRHAAVVFRLQAFRRATPAEIGKIIRFSLTETNRRFEAVITSYVDWVGKHPGGMRSVPMHDTGIGWRTMRRSVRYLCEADERLAALRQRFDRICEAAGMEWEAMAASPLELYLAAYFAIEGWRWEEPPNTEQRIIIDEFADAVIAINAGA